MEKKNTVLLTVIAVATLLVAVVGATFAYFSATVTETDKTQTVLESAKLGITFDGTQEVNAPSIEPGWSAQKKFTVENTSDYNMTFDINLINVVNDFERPQDLTYSLSGNYVQGSNNKTYGTDADFGTAGSVVQAVDTTTGTQTALNITAQQVPAAPGSVTYAVDEQTGEKSTTPTFTPLTTPTLVARVFIPARAKIEFTQIYTYAYLAETNQNIDQGKYFKATVSVTANGIESSAGSASNGEYATNTQTPATNTQTPATNTPASNS